MAETINVTIRIDREIKENAEKLFDDFGMNLSTAFKNRVDMNKTDLTTIPGIGKNMAQHLINAGYPTVESLKGQDPEEIYRKDCLCQGLQVDRCALYVYRLAVAYANGAVTGPEQLKWWNWKD